MSGFPNRRMVFSLAVSVLFHGMLLFPSSGNWLPPRGQVTGVTAIAVQLEQRSPERHGPEGAQAVMVRTTPAVFEVPLPERSGEISAPEAAKDVPEAEPEVVREKVTATPSAGSSAGMGLPKQVFLPWTQGLEVRPVSQSGLAADNSQQVPERYFKQPPMARVQVLVSQLNESLSGQFAKQGKAMSGSCRLSKQEADEAAHLACAPANLDDVVRSEKPKMMEVLAALRAAGNQRSRISIDFRAGKLTLGFHEEAQANGARP